MSFWEWTKRLFTPPVFAGDEEKTRVANLLNVIIWIGLVTTLVGVLGLFLLSERDMLIVTIFSSITLAFVGFFVLLHRGYVRLLAIAIPLTLWIIISIPLWLYEGIRDTAMLGYFLVIIIAGLVSNTPVLTVFVVLSILSTVILYVAELTGLIEGLPGVPPVSDIVFLTIGVSAAGLLLRNVVGRIAQESERARLSAQALAESNRELEVSRDKLAAQTRILEHRARSLQANAVVAQEASASVSDLPRLLDNVAHMVSQQFGFYHVGVFLLDNDREWAVLQAASNHGGAQMIAEGYHLLLGERCVVCQAVRQGAYCLARGTDADAVAIRMEPLLPDTRSELALPLQAGREVIGVLDVHSTQIDAFTDEGVATLQSLANQIALAVSNARLFQQVQESLEIERELYGRVGREGWQSLLRTQSDLGYLSDEQGVRSAADLWEPQMETALKTGERAIEEAFVSLPIRVRGEVIGVVDGRKPDGSSWNPQEIELLEAMTEQLNVALESARLYQDTQRRAAREQVTREISDLLQRATGMDALMRIAAEELNKVLGSSRVYVRLGTEATQEAEGETNHAH